MLVLPGALMVGCGGGSKSVKGDTKVDVKNTMSATNDKSVRANMARCDDKGKRIVKLDMNNDGQEDVWKLVVSVKLKGTTVDVMSCRKVDFNHDGDVDMAVSYDDQQAVLIEHFDLDFDGHFDQMTFYEKGTKIRVEWDTAHDSKTWSPDVFDSYRHGMIDVRTRDTNRDGDPDYWERFRDGKLEAIGYDKNGDKVVDGWDQTEKVEDGSETSPITGAGGAGGTSGTGTEAKPAAGEETKPEPVKEK